ncbi:M20 metallopeptidase family protein [Planococcus lenghuensis]|uniref:Hydrolase n=1 Tax=Planococcus lenghuensis TaxID=2213202 RepID=A0A1Q2KY13_9BACL|nr:amidohydrolase [Planococcus lenghuensis]AQQ53091.1 hydrolase [Planococcus lenghuensis]
MDLQETLTKHRRTLHQIPELSFEEFKTAAYIRNTLDELGIPYMTPLETATVVYLEGNSTTTVGFRADIDGLPIAEENEISFKSVHVGAMHACGHDGHTSMLLTFAERCQALQQSGSLPHNVLLLFQPSEEANAGAGRLVREFPFADYNPAAIFGLHLMPDNPAGTLLTKNGPLTASATEYRIHIDGKSAHVANKETGANALGALNAIVSQIQQLQHFFLSGLNQNIVHIGKMQAGEAINTVPSNAYLEGTIRTYELGDLKTVQEKLQAIAAGTDALFGTSTRVEFAEGYPPVVNDPSLLPFVTECAAEAGLDVVLKDKPYLFGEDFSFYRDAAVTHFAFLGVQDKGQGYTSGLHTARFNFDETSLTYGVRFYETILQKFGETQ